MIIIDDFLTDADAAIADAHEAGFRDAEYWDGAVYPDVSPGASTELRSSVVAGIQQLTGFEIKVKEFFYRRSKKGCKAPHWAHSDGEVSQYVALIYLTDPPDDVDAGTVILEHVDGWRGHPSNDDQLAQWKADTNDPSRWKIIEGAKMQKNRIVIHRANELHAAMPFGGFGRDVDARLVLICFFDEKEQYVRLARPTDIPALAELALEFSHERGPSELGMSVNVPAMMAAMNNSIINDPMYGCFVAISKSQIVGTCAVRICSSALDPRQLIGSEQFWYVTPAHRKTRLGLKLYDATEEWARAMGADLLDFIALAASEDSVSKFYLKRGYKELETHFLKVL
jgi:GNAT superfamily N-acetyltransferase